MALGLYQLDMGPVQLAVMQPTASLLGPTPTVGVLASDTIIIGTGTSTGVSNEFNLPQIDHFNIPNLTTLANGTGTLVSMEAPSQAGSRPLGTYNLVEKIDKIISTIQGQLPAEIIFTTTSTNPPNVTRTVPAGVNSITIGKSLSKSWPILFSLCLCLLT